MRFACWIPTATNIHSEYITCCCSTATMVAPTRLNFRFCLSYCVLMRRFIISVFTKNVTAAKLNRNSSERRKSSMSLSLSMGVNMTSPIVTVPRFYFLYEYIINKKFKLCSYYYKIVSNEMYFFFLISKQLPCSPSCQSPSSKCKLGFEDKFHIHLKRIVNYNFLRVSCLNI
jgi:hypothetical protein